MAHPGEVQDGMVFEFDFRRSDFNAGSKDKRVVVLVKDYSDKRGDFKALVAPVQQGGKGYLINSDELYTVPVEKLEGSDEPLQLPLEDVVEARRTIKSRILDY